jgi:hypothetical protein
MVFRPRGIVDETVMLKLRAWWRRKVATNADVRC